MTQTTKIIVLVVLLVFICAVFLFFSVPMALRYFGLIPDPLKEIFDYPALGVTINKPDTEDTLDWGAISKNTSESSGIFLVIGNRKNQEVIHFVYFPLEQDKDVKTWLFGSRSQSNYYSNMEYKDITVAGIKAVEEISDYNYGELKEKYYTVVMEHKNHFIVMEASSPKQSFDDLVRYCEKILKIIKLY